MNSKQRTISRLLVLVLTVPGLAIAMGKGRLIGKVVDPEGKVIPGVTVVATSEQVSGFRETDTTDAKGVFKFDFSRLYVVYRLHFEKDGYQSFDSEQTWELEGTEREEFTMQLGETAVDAVPVASSSREAIQAFNGGVSAFNAKDYVTAAAKFEEALKHDSNLHQAWAALSKIHLKQEQYQEAVEAAEKAIALGSTDESVWRSRWEGYRNLGDEAKTAAALADLESAGVRTKEAARVYNEAVALTKSGDYQGAFETFQHALEIDPNLQAALLGLATTGLEVDRNAEAATAAETILNADPSNEQALRIRYNAALKLGNEEKLVDSLVGLAAVEPVVARDSLLRLAFDAYDANDMTRAKRLFGKVLEVDQSYARAHYLLALIDVNDGTKDEAKGHLQRFLQLAPDDPDAGTARDLLEYLNKP